MGMGDAAGGQTSPFCMSWADTCERCILCGFSEVPSWWQPLVPTVVPARQHILRLVHPPAMSHSSFVRLFIHSFAHSFILLLHMPFIDLPSYTAPQPAREASVERTFLARIVPMVTPVVKKGPRLQGRSANAHAMETRTWRWPWRVGFSLSDATHR